MPSTISQEASRTSQLQFFKTAMTPTPPTRLSTRTRSTSSTITCPSRKPIVDLEPQVARLSFRSFLVAREHKRLHQTDEETKFIKIVRDQVQEKRQTQLQILEAHDKDVAKQEVDHKMRVKKLRERFNAAMETVHRRRGAESEQDRLREQLLTDLEALDETLSENRKALGKMLQSRMREAGMERERAREVFRRVIL